MIASLPAKSRLPLYTCGSISQWYSYSYDYSLKNYIHMETNTRNRKKKHWKFKWKLLYNSVFSQPFEPPRTPLGGSLGRTWSGRWPLGCWSPDWPSLVPTGNETGLHNQFSLICIYMWCSSNSTVHLPYVCTYTFGLEWCFLSILQICMCWTCNSTYYIYMYVLASLTERACAQFCWLWSTIWTR